MDDQRAVGGREHPDLDQFDGPVGTEKQGDVVVTGVGGDGDEVAQGMTDIFIGDAMVRAGPDRRLHSATVSVYPDGDTLGHVGDQPVPQADPWWEVWRLVG